MTRFEPPLAGWNRDLPDLRDFTLETPLVAELLARLGGARAARGGSRRAELPPAIDHREFCSPPRDVPPLRMAAPQACTALVEYFDRRTLGRAVDLSATFLYKVARRDMHAVGDAGCGLRAALKAMCRCGLPPAEFTSPDPDRFDDEPEAYLYTFGRNTAGIAYLRLDAGAREQLLLKRLKSFLAAGFAISFGFTLPSSLDVGPDIPFPTQYDGVRGGQALVAVGYDDKRRIRSAKGALLVRSGWSADWGEAGYGWLPYRYVEEGLAADFWTLLRRSWIDSGELSAPRLLG